MILESVAALGFGVAIGWYFNALHCRKRTDQLKMDAKTAESRYHSTLDQIRRAEDKEHTAVTALASERKLRETAMSSRDAMRRDRDKTAIKLTKYQKYWKVTTKRWQDIIIRKAEAAK